MLRKETIYVAPGENQCRVYALPYAMRPGQSPRDILPQYQNDWAHIALLNHKLKLVYIEPDYRPYADDIEGQMGGTFFEIERDVPESKA
jgi:hypothetical protein